MLQTVFAPTEHYTSATATKRPMTNPQAWVGKVINRNKWELPEGYDVCAMTRKLHPYSELEVTFAHWKFERAFLLEHNIYVEDAEWLSEDGYFEIMDVLQKLDLYDYYLNC